MWGLAAFTVVAILYVLELYLVKRQRGRVPAAHAIVGLIVVALVPILGSLQLQREGLQQKGIYHLRVTVLDPQGMPTNDAQVWSSTDSIPKKVDGGWEFSIPAGSKPAEGRLTVYARVPNAFWQGQRELRLADEYYPTATVRLRADDKAQVRGIVQDAAGRAVAGARVCVVGYPAEAFTTKEDGNFVLLAHAAEGQEVELHAEKPTKSVNQWHPAGTFPVTLVLNAN